MRKQLLYQRNIYVAMFQQFLCNRNRQIQETICDDRAELDGVEYGCFGPGLGMPGSSNTFYQLR